MVGGTKKITTLHETAASVRVTMLHKCLTHD